METFRLKPGDILLNEASGSATEVGKPAIWSGEIEECAFQNTLLRVRCGPNANPQYLLHYFRWQAATSAFARGSRGVGINHLGRDALAKWPVPLPSLHAQRRIASILDHADAALRKRRHTVSLTKSIERAAFAAACRDGDTRASLAELGITFTSGKNVVGSAHDTHPDNRVIKVSAISSGQFDPAESKPMPTSYTPPPNHRIHSGDVLFGRASGSLDLLGATAIVDKPCDNLFLPDKVWRLEVPECCQVLPDFVLGILRSQEFLAFVRHNASGAAGVRNIAKAKLLQYRAPVPARDDQQTYCDVAARSRRQARFLAESTKFMDELLGCLQSRAFSGQL
ncbi:MULTISPECIES: restriction endonuclease subunit S [unclassified Mycobacterium]|uniref:restriction endonuclease subunit S n=1 Tax=unclassified Mycobacterium TaxID=2642494 RepID=UPI001E57E591|nr:MULTISPECIES: restriction endonuclease subunit S [unclassified Mycobacterium]